MSERFVFSKRPALFLYHPPAGLSTTAADFRAFLLADCFAGLGAGFADFGARATSNHVER